MSTQLIDSTAVVREPGAATLEASVRAAVAAVPDPEYPDVSIIDLGLLESLSVGTDVDGTVARIGLIPTFSGCPALDMIASDVRASVESLDAVDRCEVTWLAGPVWDSTRLTRTAQSRLADDYTVVLRRKDGSLLCPVCGSDAVVDQAMAGPTRCRSVAWCPSCRNPVEVMR
jgi:ring-1,2-phenylacetyl-CoA epoxidase subunit PaaD